MSNRYRLVPFGPADVANPEALLNSAAGIKATALVQPAILQWSAVLTHLQHVGAKSLLMQEGVRDPDFLAEYEAFYSRQIKAVPRHCVRIHAFSIECPTPVPGDAQGVLAFIDQASAQQDRYLGFTTVRPLRHAPVGATILVERTGAPALCKDRFPVHIAGTKFTVLGTPYLQQDNAVGACAQASIWMALRTLRRRAGNSAYSPAELTVSATKYTALNRVFPGRQGLTVGQMLEAIRASDHDPLVIPLAEPGKTAAAGFVIEAAQPYLESGLPVITLLNQPVTGGHAVVGIGLTSGPPVNYAPSGVIMHNDNEGPYLELPRNVPKNSRNYSLEQTGNLIVPLPEGVFMSAAEARPPAMTALSYWLPSFLVTPPSTPGGLALNPMVLRIYLCTRHAFRKWAKDCQQLDVVAKEAYRISEMPKLVWMVEFHSSTLYEPCKPSVMSRIGEVVLDAAADALHGDALVFLRLTSALVPVGTSSPGLLVTSDETVVALATGALVDGIAEPWEQD
jgi:hypothetical protein